MKYSDILLELVTMPGEIPKPLEPEKLLYLDTPMSIPGFDKAKVLEKLKITEVAFQEQPGQEVHGYSVALDRTLAIKRNTPYPVKILWHELGHILLGHTGQPFSEAIAQEREAEAEAVAYVLCTHYRYNQGKMQARGYVQGWHKGKISPESEARITKAVDQIINANERTE